jgi:hypothetical protein
MNAKAARMIVASPARRLMKPVRASVEAVGEFGCQEAVDEAVARDAAEAGESPGDDARPVMGLTALARPRVPGVAIRFVDDLKENWIERLRQTRDNSFLHHHAAHSR